MRVAWLLILAPTIAAGDDWDPRVIAGAGLGYRAGDLAILAPQGPNLTVGFDVRVRPALFVGASYDHASGTASAEDAEIETTTNTAGVHVRNTLLAFGSSAKSFGGEWFVLGGVGREWTKWRGGDLARNVVELGVGTAMRIPRGGETHREIRFGLRAQIGRAPEPAKRPVGCDGPCDTPTSTRPYDASLIMEVSCLLGR
jgi:hypothetical protein